MRPITAAWGRQPLPRVANAVMLYPISMGRVMVAAETAPVTSPLIVLSILRGHPLQMEIFAILKRYAMQIDDQLCGYSPSIEY